MTLPRGPGVGEPSRPTAPAGHNVKKSAPRTTFVHISTATVLMWSKSGAPSDFFTLRRRGHCSRGSASRVARGRRALDVAITIARVAIVIGIHIAAVVPWDPTRGRTRGRRRDRRRRGRRRRARLRRRRGRRWWRRVHDEDPARGDRSVMRGCHDEVIAPGSEVGQREPRCDVPGMATVEDVAKRVRTAGRSATDHQVHVDGLTRPRAGARCHDSQVRPRR